MKISPRASIAASAEMTQLESEGGCRVKDGAEGGASGAAFALPLLAGCCALAGWGETQHGYEKYGSCRKRINILNLEC